MDKQVVLDKIEVSGAGGISLRLFKQIVDGSTVLCRDYHRVTLNQAVSLTAARGEIESALALEGWPAMSNADWEKIEDVAGAV